MTWLVSKVALRQAVVELANFGHTARLAIAGYDGLEVDDFNTTLLPPAQPIGTRIWWADVGLPLDLPPLVESDESKETDASPVTVSIEHYAQLKRTLEHDAPDRPPLAFRVETAFGHKSLGTRPGRETQNVVEAIRTTDRATWAGLSVAIRSGGMAEAAAGCLEDCRDAAGQPEATISYTATDPNLRPLLPPGSECVLEVPVVGLRAQVVGRPSLERAVLDVGTIHNLRSRQTLAASGGELRVIVAEPHRSLVEWTEPLHDHLIGSVVDLDTSEGTGRGPAQFV